MSETHSRHSGPSAHQVRSGYYVGKPRATMQVKSARTPSRRYISCSKKINQGFRRRFGGNPLMAGRAVGQDSPAPPPGVTGARLRNRRGSPLDPATLRPVVNGLIGIITLCRVCACRHRVPRPAPRSTGEVAILCGPDISCPRATWPNKTVSVGRPALTADRQQAFPWGAMPIDPVIPLFQWHGGGPERTQTFNLGLGKRQTSTLFHPQVHPEQ